MNDKKMRGKLSRNPMPTVRGKSDLRTAGERGVMQCKGVNNRLTILFGCLEEKG